MYKLRHLLRNIGQEQKDGYMVTITLCTNCKQSTFLRQRETIIFWSERPNPITENHLNKSPHIYALTLLCTVDHFPFNYCHIIVKKLASANKIGKSDKNLPNFSYISHRLLKLKCYLMSNLFRRNIVIISKGSWVHTILSI